MKIASERRSFNTPDGVPLPCKLVDRAPACLSSLAAVFSPLFTIKSNTAPTTVLSGTGIAGSLMIYDASQNAVSQIVISRP